MRAVKLASPVRELYLGQASPAKNLAYLSRSASTQPSSSKYGFRGADHPAPSGGGEEIIGAKKNLMLTRGASFRRQGSSGMTWANNWIFTDDDMFSGRHSKVSDDKGAARNGVKSVPRETSKRPTVKASEFPDPLQRSPSTGSGTAQKQRSHKGGLWGFKWLKKNLRKAFR